MRKIAFVLGPKNKKEKTSKQLERHLKGISNSKRIDIILLVSEWDGMTLEQIHSNLNCHIATVFEHTAKLTRAGLIYKIRTSHNCQHRLTPYGKIFVKFIKSFKFR